MKCPLIGASNLAEWPREWPTEVECITTECAWFDEQTGVCAVLSLPRILTTIGNVLGKIHDKMPTRIQLLK